MCVVYMDQVKDSNAEGDCITSLNCAFVAIPVLIFAEQFGPWLHGVKEVPLSVQLSHACIMFIGSSCIVALVEDNNSVWASKGSNCRIWSRVLPGLM